MKDRFQRWRRHDSTKVAGAAFCWPEKPTTRQAPRPNCAHPLAAIASAAIGEVVIAPANDNALGRMARIVQVNFKSTSGLSSVSRDRNVPRIPAHHKRSKPRSLEFSTKRFRSCLQAFLTASTVAGRTFGFVQIHRTDLDRRVRFGPGPIVRAGHRDDRHRLLSSPKRRFGRSLPLWPFQSLPCCTERPGGDMNRREFIATLGDWPGFRMRRTRNRACR